MLFASPLSAATRSAKLPVTARWGRFEQAFKSSVTYTNPLQREFRVNFTSPSGRSASVFGFWDGRRTWRVRFMPDEPGRWTYRTTFSDARNQSLNAQSGAFVCTAPIGQSRFHQHGPIQVGRDGKHFEHADGTPFFWLADITWAGGVRSKLKDWREYAEIRSSQKFSAVQWAAFSSKADLQSAFSDNEPGTLNLEFFRSLDSKVDALNQVGLLSVIAPFWASSADALPADQIAQLLRYMTARWGANDVAWLLTAEGGAERSREIGRAVFGVSSHAPVVAFAGALRSARDEFQNEQWVEAFGYGLGQHMDEDSFQWLVNGPMAKARGSTRRPVIQVLPPLENSLSAQNQQRINADDLRRVLWAGLLLTTPAGVSYGSEGVAFWDNTLQEIGPGVSNQLPLWRLSLFLPGAKQMSTTADFFSSVGFWRLTPSAHFLAIQPGATSPRRYIAAAETPGKDLVVVYVPQDRTIEAFLNALPPSPVIQWLNPRTGEKKPAVAVVGAQTCQLPTPDKNDWLLVIKSGK